MKGNAMSISIHRGSDEYRWEWSTWCGWHLVANDGSGDSRDAEGVPVDVNAEFIARPDVQAAYAQPWLQKRR